MTFVALVAMLAAIVIASWGDAPSATGVEVNEITAPDTGGNVGLHTSIVLDGAGNPVVSYYDVDNGDLKLLHCGNAACTSGNSTVAVDETGDVGRYTSLALNASGFPVISYYDIDNGDLKVAVCGDANCSAGNNIETVDGSDDVGKYNSLALDGSDLPVISYYDETNGDLKVASCGDTTCSSGNTVVTVDAAGNVGADTSLMIDRVGNPAVSYLDVTNFDLKVLRCGDTTCSSGNSIVSPDTTHNVGFDSSIYIDAFNIAVVSYYESVPTFNLKVLRCGVVTCNASNSIISPDTGGSVGRDSSLQLDNLGRPIVSYEGNGNLKTLHCGNPFCSANNHVTSPDTPGSVGYHTSLVLNAFGIPVISYYDASNDDLKLITCPLCRVCEDFDGDLICDELDDDDDNDGCTDERELQTAPGSQSTGGRRDPYNHWDFYDVWTRPADGSSGWERDGVVTVQDILSIVQRAGEGTPPETKDAAREAALTPPAEEDVSGYHPSYDRGELLGPNAWNVGSPDGAITTTDDVLAAVQQFGHRCI